MARTTRRIRRSAIRATVRVSVGLTVGGVRQTKAAHSATRNEPHAALGYVILVGICLAVVLAQTVKF